MRKSVERRLQSERTPPAKQPGFFRRHLWVVITIPVLIALTGGGLWYMQVRAAADTKARAATQAERLAAIAKDEKAAIQKKIDDARKAEAEAKAKAAEEEANRKAEAAAKPSGTTSAATCDVTEPAKVTIVINKKHCFNPLSWAPSDLASVNGYLLRSEAANQMIAMMNAAATAGVGFDLSSAYRSYRDQVATYNYWVATNGSQAAADTVSARPGYSEHQTGLAADLKAGGCALECFANTAQYTWLTEHAAEYGFIQRYPVGLTSITGYSPEAWHWRYVGVATATDMKQKGIQTLEQYFGVTGGDYA